MLKPGQSRDGIRTQSNQRTAVYDGTILRIRNILRFSSHNPHPFSRPDAFNASTPPASANQPLSLRLCALEPVPTALHIQTMPELCGVCIRTRHGWRLFKTTGSDGHQIDTYSQQECAHLTFVHGSPNVESLKNYVEGLLKTSAE